MPTEEPYKVLAGHEGPLIVDVNLDDNEPFSDPRPPGFNHFCNCGSMYAQPPDTRRVSIILEPGVKYGCVTYQEYIRNPDWRDGKHHPWKTIEWHSWEGGPLANEYGVISL